MRNDKKESIWQKKFTVKSLTRKLLKDKRIALIKIEGVILDSSSFPITKKIIKSLKEVEEEKFKALVIRINSPGGAVGASQEIYDTIQKLKTKNIKVIASYGDVSASGGVYIGCSADKIVSNPGSITGSIGVIISSSNFKKLYDKIGIDSEVVKSGPYKDILSTHRYLTDEEKVILQSMIDDTYNQFVEVVSKGRNLEPEKVRKFADGRIFTGKQALELGLVDKIGSLRDAIDYAAELVSIEGEPKIVDLSPQRSMLHSIFNSRLRNIELMMDYSGIPMWLMPQNISL